MYIRRKVFSLLQDETGEERYFSTTEFEDERLYTSRNNPKKVKRKRDHARAERKRLRKEQQMKGSLGERSTIYDTIAKEESGSLQPLRDLKTNIENSSAGNTIYDSATMNNSSATNTIKEGGEGKLRSSAKKTSNKVGNYIKRAWNGEVGKLGKIGNRALMIATPVVATGTPIVAKVIKSKHDDKN